MSRFHGRQSPVGSKKDGRHNKGVLRAYRENLRIQAEVRQEDVDPRNSKERRLCSTFNPATGKREPWSRFPKHQRNWESRMGSYLAKNPETAAVHQGVEVKYNVAA